MVGKVKSRKLLQDGRFIFGITVGEGKDAKEANLMLTAPMIAALKEVGDSIPKVGSEIHCEWATNAAGEKSGEWLSI